MFLGQASFYGNVEIDYHFELIIRMFELQI